MALPYSLIVRTTTTYPFKIFLRRCSSSVEKPKLELINRRCNKIPPGPVEFPTSPQSLPPKTTIDKATIEHLERLALVDFGNEAGIKRLEDAIRFADELLSVDTTDVEPLITVLEDRNLYLREDEVTMTNSREDILANAVKTEENYFVAPPGNIPVTSKAEEYFVDVDSKKTT